MQIIKPQALGLSMRPIEHRKRFGLCVSAYLYLPFAQDERGSLWAEQSMWAFLADEMTQPLIDEGVSKLTPEFLIHGNAYPPAGQNACAVRAHVGSVEKTVLVFGDRYWNGTEPSTPAPFDVMPLDGSRAYGGPDFAANPIGRGRRTEDGVQWLPNLELPTDRMLRSGQAIAPAGFGALDPMHPQRVRYRGTYDANYLQQHAPGFAPDTDWHYFNVAPSDQWLQAPLTGTEAFAFHHMHPTQAVVQGRLPGLRAKAFAGYAVADGEPTIREVPLTLTTLWFFPHAERCIAVFHGLAKVAEDDASDVVSLLGAVERIGEPRADAHYMEAAQRRAHPTLGGVYSMIDTDLLPEGVSTHDPAVEAAKAPFAMQGLQAEAQYRRAELDVEMARDKARAMGQDPDELGIVMPPREEVPEGDALPAYLESKLEEAEQQQWAVVEQALDLLEKGLDEAEARGVDPADLAHRGPPTYRAEKELEKIRMATRGTASEPDWPQLEAQLHVVEDQQRVAYWQGAHMQPSAYPMPADEAAVLRAEMRQAMAAGIRYFHGLDFTGANFSGLDLRGVDFSEAWLESVDLTGANLSGARFERAVLAHAHLDGVTAIGTDFQYANVGRASLSGAVFDGADFSGAVLMGCAFAGTQAHRARFAGANLFECTWGQADWSEADLQGQTLYRFDLQGMRWPGANLAGCNIIECEMTGVDMRGANLEGATFVTCQLDAAQLAGAQATAAIFVKGCTLVRAELNGAVLERANFGDSDLSSARLAGAMLNGANLSETKLVAADLRRAQARAALLRRAQCAGANFWGANLQDAILQHANLRGADLRQANLFSADLARVKLDTATRVDGALMARARTWPRLTREQQEAAP